MIFAITWRPALFVVGPLILLAIFLFVSSFVALGFNMASVKDVLDEDDANNTATDNISQDIINDDPTTVSAPLLRT